MESKNEPDWNAIQAKREAEAEERWQEFLKAKAVATEHARRVEAYWGNGFRHHGYRGSLDD